MSRRLSAPHAELVPDPLEKTPLVSLLTTVQKDSPDTSFSLPTREKKGHLSQSQFSQ
jgi:hypothetical protein